MKYYYYENEQAKGPYSIEELSKMNLSENDYLCLEGSQEWIAIKDIPEFKSLISNSQEPSENFDAQPSQKAKKNKTWLSKILIVGVIIIVLAGVGIGLKISFFRESKLINNLKAKSIWKKGLLLLTAVDVWQGDGLVIITPNKKVVVIDGGLGYSYYRSSDYGINMVKYLRKNKVDNIDIMLITHSHSDHLGGPVTIMKNIKVNTVIEPGLKSTSKLYKRFLREVKKRKIKYMIGKKGTVISLDKNIKAKILNDYQTVKERDSAINNSSLALKLTFNKFSALLTGDIEKPIEKMLLNEKENLKSTVLKIPHHGSPTSSTIDFLKAVNPKYLILTVGLNNKFYLPKQEVLDRYKKLNAKLFRTDLNGTIEFLTDGVRIEIRTEKKADPKKLYKFFRTK